MSKNSSYILGICGHAGAGKDMVADLLIKKLDFIRIALAAPIKEIAHNYFGIPWEELRRSDKPEKVRKLLQHLGTDVGRAYDPDIWVRRLGNTINNNPFERIVITDVRFPNEAETLVKEYGADLILIERPDNPNSNKPMMRHDSETSIDKIPTSLFTAVVINREDKQDEMLNDLVTNIEEWVRCHNFPMNPT